jgi:ParB family chromosome partitioning protein
MAAVVSVNPFHCRMWELNDRLDVHVNEETCSAEIESFSKHGQIVPVLGRPLIGDPNYKVELVFGTRRLFVARHLNKQLLVEVRPLSDREAIIAMDIENRQRTDISPYERGMSYARWMRAGHFGSQEDIAKALKISASQVSRLLKLAQLPTVIVDAFESGVSICEGWGLDLMEALEDPKRRQRTVQAARMICAQSPRPAAREVYRNLMASAARGRKVAASEHDEVIKDEGGNVLFRIRQQSNSIAFLLPLSKVSAKTLRRVSAAVAGILRDAEAITIPSKAVQADSDRRESVSVHEVL